MVIMLLTYVSVMFCYNDQGPRPGSHIKSLKNHSNPYFWKWTLKCTVYPGYVEQQNNPGPAR